MYLISMHFERTVSVLRPLEEPNTELEIVVWWHLVQIKQQSQVENKIINDTRSFDTNQTQKLTKLVWEKIPLNVSPYECFDCDICTLKDILKNEDLNLDDMFIASLVADLVKVRAVFRNFFESLKCQKDYYEE